jgi:methylated-DNA-protein-cysteine methyltransferase-like protein
MSGLSSPKSSSWQRTVWRAVQLVPRGRVTTYGDVAAFVGHPARARQVGGALGALPVAGVDSVPVPWHRVVNARGFLSIRGSFVGKDTQRALLLAEGVDVDDAFLVAAFAECRWRFPPPRSLAG